MLFHYNEYVLKVRIKSLIALNIRNSISPKCLLIGF